MARAEDVHRFPLVRSRVPLATFRRPGSGEHHVLVGPPRHGDIPWRQQRLRSNLVHREWCFHQSPSRSKHTTGRCALRNFDPEQLRQVYPDLLKEPRRQDLRCRIIQTGDVVQHAMVDQVNHRADLLCDHCVVDDHAPVVSRTTAPHAHAIRVAMHPTALVALRNMRQPMRRIEVEVLPDTGQPNNSSCTGMPAHTEALWVVS